MEFLAIYSVAKVQRDLQKVKTIAQALKANTPSLTLLRKTYGERQIEAYIKLWIIQLNELLNLKRYLNQAQINECARLILSEFWGLTIADINIVFTRAKMGDYGQLYESLSIHKVLSWFKEYRDDRLTIASQVAEEEHRRVKEAGQTGERSFNDKHERDIQKFYNQHKMNQVKEEYKKRNGGKDE